MIALSHNSALLARLKGSATTEFAILTLALLPIMIGIPMLGKMADLKQTTINASRYAAWEATVSDASVQNNQVEARFFGDAEAKLKTASNDITKNDLWGENNAASHNMYFGQGVVQVMAGSAAVSTTPAGSSSGSGTSKSAGFGQVVKKVGSILSWAPGTDWGIKSNGLLNATVQMKVKPNKFLNQSNSNCHAKTQVFSCMTSATSIMVDNWSASNDYQASRRTRSFVPTTTIRSVSDTLAASGSIPVLKDLKGLKRKGGQYGFGHVDMKPLPRLLGTYTQ